MAVNKTEQISTLVELIFSTVVINLNCMLETTLRDSGLSEEKTREVEIRVEVKRVASEKPRRLIQGQEGRI